MFDNFAVWHEISSVLLGLMARISGMDKAQVIIAPLQK